eukprot:2805845-Amphidinium_carterae.1
MVSYHNYLEAASWSSWQLVGLLGSILLIHCLLWEFELEKPPTQALLANHTLFPTNCQASHTFSIPASLCPISPSQKRCHLCCTTILSRPHGGGRMHADLLGRAAQDAPRSILWMRGPMNVASLHGPAILGRAPQIQSHIG